LYWEKPPPFCKISTKAEAFVYLNMNIFDMKID